MASTPPYMEKICHENKAEKIFHDVLYNFYELDQFKEMYYSGEIDSSCFIEYLREGISCASKKFNENSLILDKYDHQFRI